MTGRINQHAQKLCLRVPLSADAKRLHVVAVLTKNKWVTRLTGNSAYEMAGKSLGDSLREPRFWQGSGLRLRTENGQLGTSIEDAEEAIRERLREVADSFSALEESELYAAMRILRRLKVQFLTAA